LRCAGDWRGGARARANQVRNERDLFVAVAELRTLLGSYPHAEPGALIDQLALRLMAHRQDMTPSEAQRFATWAAHHVAAGSEAWSPALPALPALPKPQLTPKRTDPNVQAFWIIVGVGVVSIAGYLLFSS